MRACAQGLTSAYPRIRTTRTSKRTFTAFVPQIIDREQDEVRLLMEMLVRSYDPCISCSTHLLNVEFV